MIRFELSAISAGSGMDFTFGVWLNRHGRLLRDRVRTDSGKPEGQPLRRDRSRATNPIRSTACPVISTVRFRESNPLSRVGVQLLREPTFDRSGSHRSRNVRVTRLRFTVSQEAVRCNAHSPRSVPPMLTGARSYVLRCPLVSRFRTSFCSERRITTVQELPT